MIKNTATVLATAALAIASLSACDGDDKATGTPSATSSNGTAPTSAPAVPAPRPTSAAPTSNGPAAGGSTVIMVDPDGKKYTRTEMVQLASGMGAAMGKKLPPNFCARSYQEGVRGGGKFPAGKQAFLDACQEGMRLAGRPQQ